MPMIFLAKEDEGKEKARIELIHYMPDDPVEGLPDEIKQQGIRVESVPEPPEPQRGKSAVLYCNPKTGDLWYEYVDRPLTQEELAQEQNEKMDLIMMSLLEQEGII